MRRTADFWRGWLNHGAFPDHPWRGILQRSALTLKGLTYAPTGALLAASTTSLPETPGGERNWDYRYSWVRDATFALWGLYTLGFDYEANSFFYFIADQIGDGSPLHVLYAVDDGVDLGESTLDHLHGLRGRSPRPDRQRRPRPGAARHLGCAAACRAPPHALRRVPARGVTWENLERPGRVRDRTVGRARSWDLGEPRGTATLHLLEDHVLGGAGPRRAAGARRWATSTWSTDGGRVADEIKADVLANGVDERGVFTQSYGSSTLDASVLLGVLLGFLPADDPRMRATRPGDRGGAVGQRPGPAVPGRTRRTTGSPTRRGRSRSARSGWSPRWSRSASSTTRARCSRSCSRWRARSASTPRSWTRGPAGTWGTSRRRSPTSR